jgi:hypothetical protein
MWVITFVGRCGSCDWRVVNILDAIAENKVTDVQWAFEIEEDAVNAISKCINCIKGHPNLQLSKFCDLPFEDWKRLCNHRNHFLWCLKAIDPTYRYISEDHEKSIIDVIKPREEKRKFFVIYDDVGKRPSLMNPYYKEIFEQGRHFNVTIPNPKDWEQDFIKAEEHHQKMKDTMDYCLNTNRFMVVGQRKAGRSTIFGDLQKLWESLTEEEQNKIEAQAYGEAVGKDLDHWQNLTPEERNEILTRKPFKQ